MFVIRMKYEMVDLGIEFYVFISHGGMNDRGPTCKFRNARIFEIYTWILCLSYLHEKQTSRIKSLYLYFIKIVPFWPRNICFKYASGRYSEQPPERPAHTSRERFHAKMDVEICLMFIAAENTGSGNFEYYTAFHK